MKRLVLSVLGLGFALSAVASENALEVAADMQGNEIQISYTTKQINSSMCFLAVKGLTLKAPNANGMARLPGVIELKVGRNPMTACLTAFGKDRGQATFERGNQLPKLEIGKYALTINGQKYGALVVSENDVELVE